MTAVGLAKRSFSAVLAVLTVGFACVQTSMAATNANGDRSQEIVDDPELSVSAVDLGKNNAEFESEPKAAEDADTALAPLLFLAPRVESILDDVFDDSDADVDTEYTPADSATSARPIAERSLGDDTAPEPQLDAQQPALLRIQREMYRTDI